MSEATLAAIHSSLDAARGGPADSGDLGGDPAGDSLGLDAGLGDVAAPADDTTTEGVAADAGDTTPRVDDPAGAAADGSIAKPAVAAKLASGDELDLDKVPERDAQGRLNRIPQPRVKQMVDASVKKAETKWAAEKLDPVMAVNRDYADRLNRIEQVEHIMFNEPARMVEILRTIPGYAEMFDRVGSSGTTKGAAMVDPKDPEPEPDVKDATGAPSGYSREGLAALRAWDRRQAARDAVDAAEQRLGSRIKPFEDNVKAVQREREQHGMIANELNHAAKNWKGFIENAADIVDLLKKDREEAVRLNPRKPQFKLTLLDAYHSIVLPKLEGNARTMRESILKEMQTAPRSTSGGPAGGGTITAKPGTPATTREAIVQSLRSLKR